MSSVAPFQKDPNDTEEYAFDFRKYLATGETISSAVWTVPAGLTKVSETVAGSEARVKVSGGTLGEDYEITCLMTTSQGRIIDRTGVVEVRAL